MEQTSRQTLEDPAARVSDHTADHPVDHTADQTADRAADRADGHAADAGGTVAFGAVPTRLGRVLVAVTERGVAATGFRDGPAARDRLARRLGLPVVDDPERTAAARGELAAYFAGELRSFTVPLDWRLTSALRRRVLGTLHDTVPYGQVITYGELSRRSGGDVPARAIGSIMGGNPIPVIVPCHRVVAGNGLGGFSGGDGVESKRLLLTMEGYLPPTLFESPTLLEG